MHHPKLCIRAATLLNDIVVEVACSSIMWFIKFLLNFFFLFNNYDLTACYLFIWFLRVRFHIIIIIIIRLLRPPYTEATRRHSRIYTLSAGHILI